MISAPGTASNARLLRQLGYYLAGCFKPHECYSNAIFEGKTGLLSLTQTGRGLQRGLVPQGKGMGKGNQRKGMGKGKQRKGMGKGKQRKGKKRASVEGATPEEEEHEQAAANAMNHPN
eukprot:1328464-Amphidinium_carterae.1